MKITIAGANGFLGGYLCDYFARRDFDLTLLVRNRRESPYKQLLWNPATGEIDKGAIDGQDVVVNLAGKNIAAERWNDKVKRAIIESRVSATELIGKTIAAAAIKPSLLFNASAVGVYGHRDAAETITEQSLPGTGFMAESCLRCEAAVQTAVDAGIRVVKLRIGVVLAKEGGALTRMLPFFRLGLGGKIGSGNQMMSWIALEEIGPIIEYIIKTSTFNGPVNVTAPNPIANAEFTRALGKVLRRPVLLPVPGFALRAAFGEMAGEVLLGGAKVVPQKLLDSGYHFRYEKLQPTLAAIFDRSI